MIIGDRSQFAAEFELAYDYHGVWLLGKFCFWVNNMLIGDYSLETSLRDILFQMTEVLRDAGNRSNDILYSLSSVQLYNRLNTALYGSEISPYDQVAIEETWARFNAKVNVDVFDGWKLFLI